MAYRPIYISTEETGLVKELNTEFQYFSGFAVSQKQKSITSLHESFLKEYSNRKVLEISSKSDNPDGKALSAFNLIIQTSDGRKLSLESAFQGGKIFENGGPYTDLLSKMPWEAKKDPRIRESGNIIGFTFDGTDFPIEPKTFFYDWLYITALSQNEVLSEKVMQYDAFTDIEFNPKKSINCQAKSAAVFVSLKKLGILDDALSSPESFKKIVYGNDDTEQQIGFL